MKKLIYFFSAAFMLSLFSCSNNDEPSPIEDKEADKVSRTILIYAINNSSLASDFSDDSREILKGVKEAAQSDARVLLYRYDNQATCGLYRVDLDKNNEAYFQLLKSYERKQTSTSPDRISEVITDALALYPNSKYDMIFWGHGSSWVPKFTGHDLATDGPQKAYGGEYNGGKNASVNYTDIDELAEAIPDHRFQTIWFDCCYMSGIEVIYQLRNKCDYLVAYPTEIYTPGMPYDLSLPYLMSREHDLVAAAKAIADYYKGTCYTVSVIDMSKLEPVADVAARVFKAGDVRPDNNTLLKYSTSTISLPLYDLRQYLGEIATLNGNAPLAEEVINAVDNMVIFHAESNIDFNKRYWDVTKISGVSISAFPGGSTKEDDYYRTLDWYIRVY
ncbi:MAG: clostripain-related cysteine peptidase [Lepagella sp.]